MWRRDKASWVAQRESLRRQLVGVQQELADAEDALARRNGGPLPPLDRALVGVAQLLAQTSLPVADGSSPTAASGADAFEGHVGRVRAQMVRAAAALVGPGGGGSSAGGSTYE